MKKILILSAFGLMLGGCASIQLNPGANNVIASPNKPPKACHYVG